MIPKLTPTEREYKMYLRESPSTTEQLMEHFGKQKRAVYQMLYSLQLKRVVYSAKDDGVTLWHAANNYRSVKPLPLTEHRKRRLEFLCEPHTTREFTKRFRCSYNTAIWNIRTLRIMGYVEQDGKTWCITYEGLKVLDATY